MPKKLPKKIIDKLLIAQESEITESRIYARLAKTTKNPDNAKVLQRISEDEARHYEYWKKYTGKEIKPNKSKINKFYWITRLLGLTFGVKLMEKGEEQAQVNYEEFIEYIPEAKDIISDEEKHEKQLIKCINEEKLEYVRSIVLGLNDALVELTGTLAGLTFALQNNQIVGIAGLITGIAASMSMASSEYLSNRAESETNKALTSAMYTGIAYTIATTLMILPFFIFPNPYISLAVTLLIVITIIAFFNFYLSVAKDYSFKKRFLEMATISMGVAFLSFIIGYLIRITLNVDL